MTVTEKREQPIPGRLLALLTLAAAVTAGNIYIAQPLVAQIGSDFARNPAETGLVLTLSQLGYVLGLVLFGPLGDVMEKRRLLLLMLMANSAVTLAAGWMHQFSIFLLLSFVGGIFSVQAQIVFPYVASHGLPQNRTRNLGIVISSCLVGVLLARTFSGVIGHHLGWRAVYLLMALSLGTLAWVVYRWMPKSWPEESLSYGPLLSSLFTLAWKRKTVRSIALTGALVYAAMTGFWASLAFYLEGPPFGLGTDSIGTFGVLGLSGALASNLTGRFLPRIRVKWFLYGVVIAMFLSYLLMLVSGPSLGALVVAVIVLDMGAQGASISNQSELYRLYHDAQARLNTIYKILYFLGAAVGSFFSTWAFDLAGWPGVCVMGMLLLALAGLNIHSQRTYQ